MTAKERDDASRNLLFLAHRLDAVTLVTPIEAELLGRRCGLPHKAHAVGNGVDMEYFHPGPQPSARQDE